MMQLKTGALAENESNAPSGSINTSENLDVIRSTYEFSTSAFLPREQFESYYDEFSIFGRLNLPKGIDAKNGFAASRNGYSLGSLRAVLSTSDAYSFARNANYAPSIMPDQWVLIQRRRGWAEIEIGNSVHRFEGAGLELRSVAKPRAGRISPNETLFLYLPRNEFVGMEALLDRISEVDSTQHIHPLLSEYLSTLAGLLPNISVGEVSSITNATIAMVRACTSRSADSVAAAQGPIMATRFEIARRYIEENLNSAELTSERVQARLAVSRRQLYKIFEGQGGVAAYIRSRRLNACHAALSRAEETRSIGVVAAEHGFNDAAQFSRQFRAEFGYSPRDARDVDRAHYSSQIAFVEWLKQP